METTTRYLEVFEELRKRKRFGTNVSVLRFVALTLATAERDDLVERLEAAADELRGRSGWSSPLRSSIRYVIAAMILKRDVSPSRVHQRVEDVRAAFRRRKMRRGGLSEILAALILVLKAEGRPVADGTVDRLQSILAAWKKDHRWLTGSDDYPMAALHATRDVGPEEVSLQVEEIYRALREQGFRRGNQLQLTSHLLAIGSAPPRAAARRFAALVQAFRERGWKISPSRYDEVAVLALCSPQPARLAQQVLAIRDRLRSHKPRPSRDLAFSLASGIVLAEDAKKRERLADTGDIAAARMAQTVLEAQQAAMAAVIAGSVAATAASASH